MKRPFLAAAGLLSLAVLALGATSVSAATTSCTGPMGPGTVTGNLKAGPGCELHGTTVTGNVDVIPGGSLETDSSAKIGGNLESKKATSIDVEDTSIGGNAKIDGTTATAGSGFTVLAFGSVAGNVEIKKSAAFLAVVGETVGGNV